VAKFVAIVSSEVVVNKLDAALRQIDTAIWLWFNEGDIVSVVTLTGAGIGILDDLFQHQKKGRPHPFSEAFIGVGMRPRDARAAVKEAQAFAKHARTDPDKRQEYRRQFAATYLFLAVAAYGEFVGHPGGRSLGDVFSFWYGIHFPDSFDPASFPPQSPQERVEVDRLKKFSRAEFFKEVAGGLSKGRGRSNLLIPPWG
jgi:hypothetical protein